MRERLSLARRLARLEDAAGVNVCKTCRDWWDVIEPDWKGKDHSQFSHSWGVWAEHGGSCPDCGRRPEVYRVLLHLNENRPNCWAESSGPR
jgi:hypothetical protein